MKRVHLIVALLILAGIGSLSQAVMPQADKAAHNWDPESKFVRAALADK